MTIHDSWLSGQSYEHYMGRWSRLAAGAFIDWLALPAHLHWFELGCGTGALSEAILTKASPASLLAVDPSATFIEYSRGHTMDPRAVFEVGDAFHLPPITVPADAVAMGLVLNYIPEPAAALQALKHVLHPGGVLAFYVWDYPGKMEMTRYFWNSATALDPDARSQDQSRRFAMYEPGGLRLICQQAGLEQIELHGIELSMAFKDFDDFWSPFLEGQGPAPSYVMRLEADKRKALENHLRSALPLQKDGSLTLAARAWAVRAKV